MLKYVLLAIVSLNAHAMRVTQVDVFDTVTMSITQNSKVIDTQQIANASFQAFWTGNVVTGSLQVQGSNDIVPQYLNPTEAASKVSHWSNYGSAFSVTSSGNTYFELPNFGMRWARLRWVPTFGSGTVTASFMGKGQ